MRRCRNEGRSVSSWFCGSWRCACEVLRVKGARSVGRDRALAHHPGERGEVGAARYRHAIPALRYSAAMSTPDRPKSEYRSAQHAGIPMSTTQDLVTALKAELQAA